MTKPAYNFWIYRMVEKLVSLDQAAKIILSGGVGVLPTDTVYGLVAQAVNSKAVARLYSLKGRKGKPGTVVAASLDQLRELGVKQKLLNTVKRFWPNPLSIVMPLESHSYLHDGLGELPFRVVANKPLVELLLKTGPLLTSSANHPGQPTSTNVNQAWNYFKDQVDFYVSAGDLSDNQPSTIIGFKSNKLVVFREGALSLEDLKLNELG